jgi:hypothetical protein
MVDSASDPEQLKTEDPNKHVVDYLRYYCDPDNSLDFAVMLKGAWGAGKTYLIKDFLEERPLSASAKKDLYISLYGMTSLQQIEDGLYRQLHPILSSKGVMLVERVTKGALKKAIGIDQDLSSTLPKSASSFSTTWNVAQCQLLTL